MVQQSTPASVQSIGIFSLPKIRRAESKKFAGELEHERRIINRCFLRSCQPFHPERNWQIGEHASIDQKLSLCNGNRLTRERDTIFVNLQVYNAATL